MTNESKAIQILRTIRGSWIPPIGAVFSPIECMQATMAMAEWKDHQFKEYLEKKKATMSIRSDWMGYHSAVCTKLIDEIINELFGEE